MWAKFQDKTKRSWVVNPGGLKAFARQYVYARLLSEKSSVVRTKQTFDLFGPIKVTGPELVTVEIDFAAIGKARDGQSRTLYSELRHQMQYDGKKTFSRLVQMHREIDDFREDLREKQQAASDETTDNVEKTVSRAEKFKNGAEVVRNLCSTTLVVGATFLTGGAAAAVLGTGSVLKGVGTYQQSGNVGAGILDASGTFVVGTIAMAPALAVASKPVTLMEKPLEIAGSTTGERVALILVGAQTDAGFEAGKSVIDGKSAKVTLQKAGLRFVLDVAGGGMGLGLDKLAFPIVVRLLTDTGIAGGSDKVVDLASGGEKEREVPHNLHPVRDCHPSIHNVQSDEDYVKRLVLKPF